MRNHEDVLAIVEELKKLYPEELCSLQYPKPYELLFSVCLVAQCTGERVNIVTPTLFARFPILEFPAQADPAKVKTYIHSTGFSRAEVRDIVAASHTLVERCSGQVPNTMEELLKLPGVGRKTTSLILDDVYHTPGVVATDTCCVRTTGRLGLTDGTKDPAEVEEQLRPTLSPGESDGFCHRMVLHGRAVCMARRPDCPNCTLRPWCDFYAKS